MFFPAPQFSKGSRGGRAGDNLLQQLRKHYLKDHAVYLCYQQVGTSPYIAS